MTIDTAKFVIDEIFDYTSNNIDKIEISFIGGEPLLEFDLIREIVSYTCSKKRKEEFLFFATTNGTILSEEMKEWFIANRNHFILGLSLDGARETQNYNRCNSFDVIDIDFFVKTWPLQGVKMTLSEYSLPRLAENIKYLHSIGFNKINGVNLAEGEFNWGSERHIKILVQQLKKLVEFYVENDQLEVSQILDKKLEICETKEKKRRKRCGIGTSNFYYVDGKKYPCSFMTPMTFTKKRLSEVLKTDFTNHDYFINENCLKNCYIFPICTNGCLAAIYLKNKSFKERDKRCCRIQKLITLFIAELQARKIEKNPVIYENNTLFHTIEAIKKIRTLYLPIFEKYLM